MNTCLLTYLPQEPQANIIGTTPYYRFESSDVSTVLCSCTEKKRERKKKTLLILKNLRNYTVRLTVSRRRLYGIGNRYKQRVSI